MSYQIRQMSEENARLSFEWGGQAGWNPGLHDWQVMRNIDPKGCFAGFLDGKMVSSITAVHYRRKYGFMGMYIVAPEYRKRGYGRAIWKHALNYLTGEVGVECIGLDGVLANELLYQTWGFHTAYKIPRYTCVVKGMFKKQCPEIHEGDFENVRNYDTRIFMVDRASFLHDFIFKTEAKTALAYSNGILAGFTVARPCYEGYKIGPLFANDAETAGILIESLFADLSGVEVSIEIPETNPEATKLVTDFNMEPGFATVRMYTSDRYQFDTNRTYGITSRTIG